MDPELQEELKRHFNYYGIVRNLSRKRAPGKVLGNKSLERMVMTNLFINNTRQRTNSSSFGKQLQPSRLSQIKVSEKEK